jgi:hypothetical protein
MTVLDRFILVIAVGILHIVISFFTFSLWLFSKLIQAIGAAMTSGLAAELMGEETASTGGFLIGFMDFTSGVFMAFEIILTIAVWAFFIFFILDLIIDFIATRRDLRELTAKDDVILATRGEYIGGYPQLPHGRFVYLVLGGSQNKPDISVILPGAKSAVAMAKSAIKFLIPLLEITETKSGVDRKFGTPGMLNFSLTSITPSIWKGNRTFLNIEYTASGRKYIVELGSFLRGNDEVQQWKNFLTCTQAEADTEERPFGPWKSLPEEKEDKA